MIKAYDNDTGSVLGELSEAQLQFLIDQLEETSTADQDYYLDPPALDMLADAGCDQDLLELLRGALGDRDGFELRWERE
jgi:processive 1,2-diacylglycerol beta-glucosyltransferase